MITEKNLQEELDKLFLTEEINTQKFNKTILVLSGGGVKGLAHLGALHVLCEHNIFYNINTYAGSSIGGLISALLIIGYLPKELYDFFNGINLKKLESLELSNLLNLFGLDDGKKMELVIKKLIIAKNIDPYITLSDLYKMTNKTLIITTVCLNDKKVYYFSHMTKPELPLIIALRMTISIPIYFVPVKYQNQLFIDGGCLDNYPIQLFDNQLEKVIGINLSEVKDKIDNFDNIENYLLNVIDCLIQGITSNSTRGYEKYTIPVKVDNISVINFSIDHTIKEKLFNDGYKVMLEYLKSL